MDMIKKILFTTLLTVLGVFAVQGQNTNPKPKTVPSLRYWKSAPGRLTMKTADINFRADSPDDARLDSLRTVFSAELAGIGVQTSPSGVKISLSTALPDSLKDHHGAYQLEISDKVTIKAVQYEGFLYATRTLLQILSQSGTALTLPKGTVTDYPVLGKRMLMLDVARKFFPVAMLEQYIRTMAWLKMNELHLHLNDNSWGAEGAYYRLPSEKYPGITSPEHYTWEDIAHIVAFARIYGITVTPELDTPGHSRALVRVRPDLKSPHHPKTDLSDAFLDIENPATYEFVGGLIGEIVPHFPAPDFHIGTDEYMLKSIRDTELRDSLGETFRRYINKVNAIVRSHGKNARIWTGFENMPGTTMPDKNITIDMWDSQDARGFSGKGYRFINSSDVFNYIVPGNIIKRYNTDHKYVYEKWNPRVFSREAAKNLLPSDGGLYGAKVNVWNDYGPTGASYSEIARQVVPSMMVFADRMWGAPKAYPAYAQWEPFRKKLAQAPLTSMLEQDNRPRKIIYQSTASVNMAMMNKSVPLGADTGDEDLEYPWTLEATLLRTARSEKDRPEVLLTSGNATLYAYLNHIVRFKNNLFDEHPGIALVRSQRDAGLTPYTSGLPQVLTFNGAIPLAQSCKLKIVAKHNYTALYIDGQLIGEFDKQAVLPLLRLGSDDGNNFKGIVQSLTIYNYVR